MSTHTPIPWLGTVNGTLAIITAKDNESVFDVSVLLNSTAHSRLAANVDLMLRAVNQHEKLVALLNDIYASYGRLHDMVSDCIEGGRLTEDMLPDDYKAIVGQLEACVPIDYRMELAMRGESDPFDVFYRVGIDEHATILAALRFYHDHEQGEPCNRSDEIHELAADLEEGRWDSLPQESIALLFQRLSRLTERKVAPLTNPDEPDEFDD